MIEFDPTGLYHAGARYYHPTLQRFISEDPARQGGSGPNLFAYAGNNPVGNKDPSGLDDCGGDCGGGPPGGGFCLFCFFLPGSDGGSSGGLSPATKAQLIKEGGLVANTAGMDPHQLMMGPGRIMKVGDEDIWGGPPSSSTLYYFLKVHLAAEAIGHGHAFTDHVREFPGISSPDQFAGFIENIIATSHTIRVLKRERIAFWDAATQTVVIENPNDPDYGTAFKPLDGKKYFDEELE